MKQFWKKAIILVLTFGMVLCCNEIDTAASIKIRIPESKSDLRREKESSSEKQPVQGDREAWLNQREEELNRREQELNEREEELNRKEQELNERAGYQENSANMGPFLSGDSLVRIGNVTDEQVAAVEEGFKKLPQKVRQIIISAGYRVEVTDEDIEKLITGGGTNSWYGASAGSPLYVILVANNQPVNDMLRTTIHECGHALANTMSGADNSELWLSCYAAEGKTLYYTAEVSNASEWFCECFVYFVMDPEYLRLTAPKSYDYMYTYLNQVLAK